MRGAGLATCWLRRRSRSSSTGRRRDTAECSDPGGRRSVPRRIRANVSYWCRAGLTPDMRYCSRPSGCVSTLLNRNRDTVSCSEATTGYRQRVAGFEPRLVEPPIGIEPMTYILQVCCSTTELRRPAGRVYRVARVGIPVPVDERLRAVECQRRFGERFPECVSGVGPAGHRALIDSP
jgi:hypothetical protein